MPKQNRVRAASAAVPAGFVNTSQSSFPKAWNPDEGETLQGIVTAVRKVSAKVLKYDNAAKGQMVTIVSVADENGEIHGVFESKALEDFCAKVKEGDEVFLRLDEVRKIGKKRFKAFTAAIKAKKGRK